jgi:putative phage-type endonuclease
MLEELIDITDKIVAEEYPNYFNDDDALELYQTCIYMMEEFIKENPKIITEPEFEDIFDENIEELMRSHFDYDLFYNEEAEEEMEEIIERAKTDFFTDFIPPRSYPETLILKETDYDTLSKKINILRKKPQPEQRTKEWYQFRYNLITASNAYKAFENQSTKNQLIYEKCQPLNPNLTDGNDDIKEIVMVNTNSTLHWGQKYEPLSLKIYEETYNTKVADFGCIQHDTYIYLGASPDGINVEPTSQRYGRMLEIKNIVNREIDGIPKKEYWIQMQLQMEVCDLDECDFLETKFIEYSDLNSYMEDTSEELFEDEDGNEFKNVCLSKEDKTKGIIIHFHTNEGKPFYAYKPLDIVHPSDIKEWEEKTIDYYQENNQIQNCTSKGIKYTYMKTIYWKLEQISCVLVCRNKVWFNDNINELAEIWSIIEKERVSGYQHRAPNKRENVKKENIVDFMTKPVNNGGCLLQFNKETSKITIAKLDIDLHI